MACLWGDKKKKYKIEDFIPQYEKEKPLPTNEELLEKGKLIAAQFGAKKVKRS
jgi:pyruvate-formate lyase-activating enzyme